MTEDEGDYQLEVIRDRWWDYGWEMYWDGANRPPECFSHVFKTAIVAGWDAAHHAGIVPSKRKGPNK